MRSPMITHGIMVFPVVTLGMIEPSAIRSLSMPRTLSVLSTTAPSSLPMRHVHDW